MINERQKYKTLPPAMWQPEEDLSDPPAGYGFTPDSMPEKDIYFFHSDHLGSTSYLTDTAGNVTQFVWYSPYGESIIDEHTTSYENPFKFSGKELDDVTGLYDHGARSRDPKTSLWLGVDSRYEDFTEYSPYNYCLGNPVIMHDPDGEMPWVAIGAIVGATINAGIAAYEGKSTNEVIAAAVSGAVNGALIASGAGIVSTIATNVAVNTAEQYVMKKEVDVSEVIATGIVSGISGAVAKGSEKIVELGVDKVAKVVAKNNLSKNTISQIKKEIKNEVKLSGKKIGAATKKAINNKAMQRAKNLNKCDQFMLNSIKGMHLNMYKKPLQAQFLEKHRSLLKK